MGTAILKGLLTRPNDKTDAIPFSEYIACVQSKASEQRLATQLSKYSQNLRISIGENANAVNAADVVILALDPSVIGATLRQPDLRDALANKLVISVASGWTRQAIEATLNGGVENGDTYGRAFIMRTLPNIAALVSQSLTAIEIEPGRTIPEDYLHLTDAIFLA
jgi:pyrroline-5-carboxylate reductase